MRNILPFASLLSAAAPSLAGPIDYNGTWRVQMVTDTGICDRSYTYAIAIRDGTVRYIPAPDDGPTTVNGRVAPDGNVVLTFQRSIATANASGRLQGSSGSGSWRLSMLGCSGRWTAVRRTARTG
jgi:hypothetical protein